MRIAARRRVLDVACGPGAVTGELAVRGAAGGIVVALDRHRDALARLADAVRGPNGVGPTCARVRPVRAAAQQLPFRNKSFDLAFCQFALMWLDTSAVAAELARILTPGGAVAAIEPDYGGMIEHPPEIATRDIWLSGLTRAGADPEIGRKLPALFSAAGFRVHVELLDRLVPPATARFQMLRGLPLTSGELHRLAAIEERAAMHDPQAMVAHLPLFLMTAELR